MPKEDLEFISVSQSDNDDMGNYNHIGGGGDGGVNTSTSIGNWFVNQSKQPVALFFHLLFKLLALFIYVFGNWFTTNFIFTFVLCIIFLAFDFWTVKNISGRLLVGLRWWSYVREDGSNEWIFESLEDMAEISAFDARIFWGAMYINPILWALLLVIGILRLKFEYLPIVVCALVMSTANGIGYIRCSSNAKNKMKNMEQGGPPSLSGLENSSGGLQSWLFKTVLAVTSNSMDSGKSNSGYSK